MGRGRSRYWKRHPLQPPEVAIALAGPGARPLLPADARASPRPTSGEEYRKRLWRLLKVRRDPGTAPDLRHQDGHALPRPHDGPRRCPSGETRIVNSF